MFKTLTKNTSKISEKYSKVLKLKMASMEMYSVRNGPVIDINVGPECKN